VRVRRQWCAPCTYIRTPVDRIEPAGVDLPSVAERGPLPWRHTGARTCGAEEANDTPSHEPWEEREPHPPAGGDGDLRGPSRLATRDVGRREERVNGARGGVCGAGGILFVYVRVRVSTLPVCLPHRLSHCVSHSRGV
jgi:hypothetical protein